MLLSLIGSYDLKGPLKSISESFWPLEYIKENRNNLSKFLPAWENAQSSDVAIQKLSEGIAKCVAEMTGRSENKANDAGELRRDIRTNKFYVAYSARGENRFRMPFSENMFRYFATRQYTIPYRDPIDNFDDIFRLFPLSSSGNDPLSNYSRNWRDHHHFLNVVVATSRLIEYFSDSNRISSLLSEGLSSYAKILQYQISPSDGRKVAEWPDRKRCFILMLAAYYHDIGKTIVYPRHAMEGSVLLSNHTTLPVYLINSICSKNYDFNFGVEDFMYLCHLVYYHDQYGTLGTGEAGYLRLVDLIHRTKRYAYRGRLEQASEGIPSEHLTALHQAEERNRILRCLFDLWVLNIADMMVSIPSVGYGGKYDFQASLLDQGGTRNRIQLLLEAQAPRKHDLCVTFYLADGICKNRHADNLSNIESGALEYARRHAVLRISRLMNAILTDYINHYNEKFETGMAIVTLQKISEIAESERHAIISRAITFESSFSEFVGRLAWVGQMDYSFGFFQRIAERALEQICSEFASVWKYKQLESYAGDYIAETNARFFFENMSTIVVQVIHHLLFKEKEFDRLVNFEFRDAAERLTEEKIDRIIGLYGPHRARRSMQLALEGIYIFS